MPHPSETDLALYAGNDLATFDRLRVEWHLRGCGRCQQEVTEFSEQRSSMRREMPEADVDWNRLSAEMKANIRLGLEAGSCIAPEPSRRKPIWSASPRWQWVAAGVAGAVLLAGGGFWFDKAMMVRPLNGPSSAEVVLAYSEDGIQMRDGKNVIGELSNLRRDKRSDVFYSVSTQGGVRASYVDQETGMVTVNNIYYGQ
jgi:hypothetical protein